MSIARAVLTGIIDSEVEKRFTPQNISVTTFWLSLPGRPLANGQPGSPSRVKVTSWRAMADVASSLIKGQVVMVEGKLTLPSYQTQEGVQKKYFEVDANMLSLLAQMPQMLQPVVTVGAVSPQSDRTVTTTSETASSTPAMVASGSSSSASSSSFDDDLYTVEDIPF